MEPPIMPTTTPSPVVTATPGPWQTWNDDIRGANGVTIACVYATDNDAGKRYGRGESDANAALIASAPELRDALTMLVNLHGRRGNDRTVVDGIVQNARTLLARLGVTL
jgi:hypothetical protein